MANTLIFTDTVDSRCGLHCTGCTWKESHGCRGCIPTNGNPFHGECPVAVCCQKRALSIADSVRKSLVIYSQAIPVMKKMETLPWAHA